MLDSKLNLHLSLDDTRSAQLHWFPEKKDPLKHSVWSDSLKPPFRIRNSDGDGSEIF